ncbi:MAG: hypothetical protein SGJ18_08065 [Pseudomonadota bacterium]|nr:hypothetical protein [Pseudomonadota bacterium]
MPLLSAQNNKIRYQYSDLVTVLDLFLSLLRFRINTTPLALADLLQLRVAPRYFMEDSFVLNRLGLIIVILNFGISSQAQNYGVIPNGLSHPQQEQLNSVAGSLEEGLGQTLTNDELRELAVAVALADLENPNLVRIGKKGDRKSLNVLFCYWLNFAYGLSSKSGGICADVWGNQYTVQSSGIGFHFGLSGRLTTILYTGASKMDVTGTYKYGIMAEGASAFVGGHVGYFQNSFGTQNLILIGWSHGLILGASGNIGSRNIGPSEGLGLAIKQLKK